MKTRLLGLVAVLATAACSGGGGTGTGGGSGGGSGGGAGGGGGGAGGPSAVSFLEVGFSSPALAVGADGVNHLAYTFGLQPARVIYRRCAGDCANGGNWAGVEVANEPDTTVDFVRLGVASDGRLHLAWEAYDVSGPRTWYATCASGCTTAANWTRTDVTDLVGGTRGAFRSTPMTVDATGRVSLVTANLPPNQPQRLSTCAANCTAASSWTSGEIRAGGYPFQMVADGTTLHMVVNNEAGALVYRTCASDCTQAANWQESPPLFPCNNSAIQITASGGRVSIAYNQGTANASEPAQVQSQNDRVLVWTCASNCLSPGSWSGVQLGEASDGDDGLALASRGGSLLLTVTTKADQTLTARVCDANCANAASWQSAVLDSRARLDAEADPFMLLGCIDSMGNTVRPLFANWYPNAPVVGIAPASGAVTVVHAPYVIRTCSSSPTRLAGIGRAFYLQ